MNTLKRYACQLSLGLTLVGALLWKIAPTEVSFLGIGSFGYVLYTVLALSLISVILVTVFKGDAREKIRRAGAVLCAVAALCFLLVFMDRIVLGFIQVAERAVRAEKNPQPFLEAMIYMFWNGRDMFFKGIWTTVRIALVGTGVAFVLALLMVFLRIQKGARQDNDNTRVLKGLGRAFAKLYITVIRGTPMMVQALIIYYAGFAAFKATGRTVTEINGIWTCFTSGLITVSLNSTAYLAEVLRGGIESIDAGQNEAARSLGMTNWQAMTKIIFPQAIKNSIPAIGNEFIINIKDSSVLSVIGCYDLMYATTSVVGIYYKSLPVYCIAAIVYLILTCLSSLLMRFISKKLDTPAVSLPSQN